jgi:hypothetical protein
MSLMMVSWVFHLAASSGFRLNPARVPASAAFLTSNALPLLVLRRRLSFTSPDRILTSGVKTPRCGADPRRDLPAHQYCVVMQITSLPGAPPLQSAPRFRSEIR